MTTADQKQVDRVCGEMTRAMDVLRAMVTAGGGWFTVAQVARQTGLDEAAADQAIGDLISFGYLVPDDIRYRVRLDLSRNIDAETSEPMT
jgi:DNA-binding IclR family transcriptional regulator